MTLQQRCVARREMDESPKNMIPFYTSLLAIDYPNISIKLAFIRSSSQLPFVDNLKRGIA